MQLTIPIAVARAVRAEMTVWTSQLQIFFFVSLSMVVRFKVLYAQGA